MIGFNRPQNPAAASAGGMERMVLSLLERAGLDVPALLQKGEEAYRAVQSVAASLEAINARLDRIEHALRRTYMLSVDGAGGDRSGDPAAAAGHSAISIGQSSDGGRSW